MSKADFFTTTDPNELKPAVFQKHCRLDIKVSDYCTYEGECKLDRLINPNRQMLCLFCTYHKYLDIPMMIREGLDETTEDDRKLGRKRDNGDYS
jgi:hypothetical protein